MIEETSHSRDSIFIVVNLLKRRMLQPYAERTDRYPSAEKHFRAEFIATRYLNVYPREAQLHRKYGAIGSTE